MDEQFLTCPVCGHQNPPEARFCQNDGIALQDGDIDDPLVGRLVGNYRLKERIGEGGFGVVYRAEHREMHTQYAVKILHPQFSANAHVAERFRREAAAAGRLRHENVVHIADFGQANGVGYYYVMEFLQGKTLKDALDLEEPFPPERVLHIARQVTSAMERVHELNIIHRDLKPENIFLITKNNQQDHVKLVDFGIAKVMDGGASITRTGLSVGTPLYMSPEQARGLLRDLDQRSDIYSWGVILFELLTYQPPFFSENPHDVVMLQIRATPPRLSDTHPYRQFSEELELFFRRVLSKKREQRPSTMTELYDEFEPLLQASDAFHDMPNAAEYHTAHSQSDHTLAPHPNPMLGEAHDAGTDPGLYSPLSDADLLSHEDTVHHEESTSIDSLPALHAEVGPDDGEPTQVRGAPPEVTAIAPNPHVGAISAEDTSSAGVGNAEGELLTAESKSSSPFIDGPPTQGARRSDSLDNIFDGLPIAGGSGEVVANARRGVSAGDTSEAMWGGAVGSLATDPNALQSPLQRFWWVFALLFVCGIGGVFWLTRSPEPKRKPHPPLQAFGVSGAGQSDGGAARAATRTPPRKAPPRAVPAPKKAIVPSKRPGPSKQPARPVIPNVRPLPMPRLTARRAPAARKKRHRLLLRSNPKASCYQGAPGKKRRLIGRTPCKIYAHHGETVYLRLSRRGYRPIVRLWTAGEDEVWMLSLRRRRRRRRVTRRRPPPPARRVIKRRPPPPRRRGDNVFNVTPNPFAKKRKTK